MVDPEATNILAAEDVDGKKLIGFVGGIFVSGFIGRRYQVTGSLVANAPEDVLAIMVKVASSWVEPCVGAALSICAAFGELTVVTTGACAKVKAAGKRLSDTAVAAIKKFFLYFIAD